MTDDPTDLSALPDDLTPFERDCFQLKAMFDGVDEANALSLLLASASFNYELEEGGTPQGQLNSRVFRTLANNVAPLKRLVEAACETALARQVVPDQLIITPPAT